jgi:hypothetical protein
MTAWTFDPDRPQQVTTERIPPVRMKRRRGGTWFVDFGRAAFARPWLRLTGRAGQRVVVRLGEVPDGPNRIHRDPGGSRRYRAIPLTLRAGNHSYLVRIPTDKRNAGPLAIPMPRHIGEVLPFRYLELQGYDRPLNADEVRQVAAFYPFDETDGKPLTVRPAGDRLVVDHLTGDHSLRVDA